MSQRWLGKKKKVVQIITPNATTNVTTTAEGPADGMVTINGQTYTLTPTTTIPASINTAIAVSDVVFPSNLSDYDSNASTFSPSVNIALALASSTSSNSTFSNTNSETDAMSLHNWFEYKAYIALSGSSHTSVNWRTNSTDLDPLVNTISPIAFTASCPPISQVGSILFILNSGANCHISPKHGNFKSLNAIPPLMVKGFGGSFIQAIGMGTIKVCMASRLQLSLMNVLFVPKSKICLLSVSFLNCSGNYITHFDSSSCWVTNCSSTTIIQGSLSPKCHLYMVALTSASVTYVPCSPTALYASHMPDIETWHRRLGHCNIRSIIEMACKEAVKGMTIDLSSTPPPNIPIRYLGSRHNHLSLKYRRA